MVDAIIGRSFRRGADTLSLEDLPPTELLGIYFGAHWAPPCRLFTPALTDFYTKVNSAGAKRMEIIFCSNDGNEAAFERNFASMPFLAVPYADEQRIQSLKQRFGINGIPTLIVLDGARKPGELISYDGRADLQNHQEGAIEIWLKRAQEMQEGAPQ